MTALGPSLLGAILTIACDSEPAAVPVKPNPALQCTVDICAVLVDRAPIIPNHTLRWRWDWRTSESCLSTMSCGAREAACRSAVARLPQLGPGSEPPAADSAIYHVWHACREINGVGGTAPRREKE